MTYIPPTNPLNTAMLAVVQAAELVVDGKGFRARRLAIKLLIQTVRAYQNVRDSQA